MKRRLSFIAAFCIVIFLFIAITHSTAKPSKEIIVLYTNDVHCGIDDYSGYDALAAVKNAFISQGVPVILADCGDAVMGETIGSISKGEYIIDIMNYIGYDVAIPGNHEFDYGKDQFNANVLKAKFPYISCNYVDANGEAVLKPYIIKETSGVKLAFVGISTPKTLALSMPSTFKNEEGQWIFGFCQDDTGEALYKKVQEAVDAAKDEGADYIVALGHLGINPDCVPWMSTDVITHTTGIDVFLDGHSHSVIESDKVKNAAGKDVILSSTGTKLENIGCLVIGTDGSVNTSLISDGDVKAFVDDIEAQYEELMDQVIAYTEVDLTTMDPATGKSMIRNKETNMGDLCADAYRTVSGAEIAFINGGGIRNDIPAGNITYGQILSVLPFENKLCVVEASGAEILDALEFSVSKLPGESGGFLQVSGIRFTVDMSVESSVKCDENSQFVSVTGKRRIKDVMVGDKPIDINRVYSLAAPDYTLKSGGDGYNMFSDNVFPQDCVMIDHLALIEYITEVIGGSVGEEYSNVYGQGRIKIVGQ